MWQCATCGHRIDRAKEGILIADEQRSPAGKIIGFVNWRCVHKITCDPDTGPWHDLDMFTGRRGPRFFRLMQKQGAFSSQSKAEIDELFRMVVQQ
jgi:hypothetical protein